jgi:hypothetical protein
MTLTENTANPDLQKKQQEAAANAEGGAGGRKKKITAAHLRIQKGK